MDGWSENVRDDLEESFSNLESLMYEVRNCVRGCYTNSETNAELAEYIRGLAEELKSAADMVEDEPDEPEEE